MDRVVDRPSFKCLNVTKGVVDERVCKMDLWFFISLLLALSAFRSH